MTGTRYGAIAVVGLWAMTLGFASAAVVADAPASAVQSTTRATANEYCPVMVGTKTEPDLWLDYAGQRIYFCHEVCKARFRRAPEKYLGNLPVAMQEAIREHQQVVAAAERPGDAVESLAPDHRGTSGLRRVGRFLGQFHPVVVHLPIGLLLAGALAEVLFIWRRAQWLSDAARFCVLLGAVAAVGAASLGWLSAMSAGYGGELARVLEYHRWLGTGTAGLAVVVAGLCEMQRRRGAAWRAAYRLALLLVAVAVGLTGHFGGTLVYGVGFLKW